MSVFGDLDMSKVSDNPFMVGEDTYPCVVTDIKVQPPREEGLPHSVMVKWKIDDPGNKYNGKPITNYYDLYTKPVEEMEPEELERASFLKLALRNGFDLSEEEINNLDSWSDLIGSKMYVKIVHNQGKGKHEGKVFQNVAALTSERLYEERAEKQAQSLGF